MPCPGPKTKSTPVEKSTEFARAARKISIGKSRPPTPLYTPVSGSGTGGTNWRIAGSNITRAWIPTALTGMLARSMYTVKVPPFETAASLSTMMAVALRSAAC